MTLTCENCGEETAYTYTHFEEESIHLFCSQACCEEWLE